MMNAFIQERDLFAPIVPFANGHLPRDRHHIYYEECGNRHGIPILFLHGGPGAGTVPMHRRLFNPDRFRIILFDQRGCGQSRPHGTLDDNSTDALIGDIEALRLHLGVKSFVLFGGSWGSTLALAYAIAYPENVTKFILRGIFLGTAAEGDWFLHDMGRFFPEAADRFLGLLMRMNARMCLPAITSACRAPKSCLSTGGRERGPPMKHPVRPSVPPIGR